MILFFWDLACLAYRLVLDFLYENNYIVNQSWIPYENMIIPLMNFLWNLPKQQFNQMNEKQREFIVYWYWSSIFSQRYGGSTNEVIVQDSNILKNISLNKKIVDRSYFKKINNSIRCGRSLFSNKKW